MPFLPVIYNVIIAPIALFIEVVFCFYLKRVCIGGVVGAIVAVSFAVNFLSLPLYNVAETLQEKERETQRRLSPGIKRIKDVFHGDERFMMLQAFYRENGWQPLQSFRSSLSILIEIPFFIAAYRFLSHCSALEGASFAFLNNLSLPDALLPLPFGGLHLNLLPILMTAVNIVSSAVYLKGLPVRDKVQTYALAIVFLVLLYNSPSGLVCYWLLNNLFSLAKNIVIARSRHPARLVYAVIALLLIAAGLYIAIFRPPHNAMRRLAVAILPICIAAVPLVIRLIGTRWTIRNIGTKEDGSGQSFILFISAAFSLALLCGLVLPAQVIGTSPIEFSFIGNIASPLTYIWHCLSVFVGLFVFWPLCIYKMFGARVRRTMPYPAVFTLIIASLDAFVFRNNYGRMDTFFHLDDSHVLLDYSVFLMLLPLLSAAGVAGALWVVKKRRLEKHLSTLSVSVCVAALVMGASKLPSINATYKKYASEKAAIAEAEMLHSSPFITCRAQGKMS